MNLNTHYPPSLIISPNKDPGMPFLLYLLTTDLGFKSIISLSYYTFLLFFKLDRWVHAMTDRSKTRAEEHTLHNNILNVCAFV